jgi:hypothetical protein
MSAEVVQLCAQMKWKTCFEGPVGMPTLRDQSGTRDRLRAVALCGAAGVKARDRRPRTSSMDVRRMGKTAYALRVR